MARTWAIAGAAQFGWTEGLLALRETALEPGNAGTAAAALAATLNAQTVVKQGGVEREDAVKRLIRANVWGAILMRAALPRTANVPQNTAIAAAIQVRDAFLLSPEFDLSDDTLFAAMSRDLAVLVTAGDISQNVMDAILAVRDRQEPMWQPPVTAADVTLARSLQDG